MKWLILYLCLAVFFATDFLPTFSQTHQIPKSHGTIKGNVYDAKTNENLVGVNVSIMNTTLGAASNADGNFEIANLPVGEHTIVASMIGYEPERREVSIEADTTVEMNIQLSERLLEIGIGKIDTVGKTYDFPQVDIIGRRPLLINRIPGVTLSPTVSNTSSILRRLPALSPIRGTRTEARS
ncbi:MAG: carboxypeptidase-like regulatory domain-containing protein [Ignavibacterium sp.]|nr:MAG: carboxypeptidase-like regulatory domain-containing protein [Ignavibacterium sp.]